MNMKPKKKQRVDEMSAQALHDFKEYLLGGIDNANWDRPLNDIIKEIEEHGDVEHFTDTVEHYLNLKKCTTFQELKDTVTSYEHHQYSWTQCLTDYIMELTHELTYWKELRTQKDD